MYRGRKFVFNGRTLCSQELFGIHRNTLSLLKELDKLVEEGVLFLVVPDNGTNIFDFEHIGVLGSGASSDSFISNLWWDNVGFTRFAKRNSMVSVDSVLATPLMGCDVSFIYDCIREDHPEERFTLKGRVGRLFYMFKTRKLIKTCKLIMTVSESAKHDILERYRCNSDKIRVIPSAWQHFEAIEEDSTVLNKLGIVGRPYFYSLATRLPHKNFKWIYEAAKQNPQQLFVASGSTKFRGDEIEGALPENLVFTGYVTDGEVKALMANCEAFVQPSLCEGFGIPPLEAMSVGARCMVSDIPVFKEIYERSAWFFNPKSYSSIDISSIMSSSIEDNSVILEKYSWHKSAELFLKEMQTIL